jgi:acyl carrier protein phosphodiesterase
MNLLAHAYLSPPGGDVRVGNVVADWVKGRARQALPAGMQEGFALHRRIDAFADTHPAMERAAGALGGRWGRYAPVLADVLFDHVLAARWAEFNEAPLPGFTAELYAQLHAARPLLPVHANHAICAMTADDWLTAYASLDGMRLALTRMSARLRHGIELAPAVDDFCACRAVFDEAFEELFAALRTLVFSRADPSLRRAS